MENNKQLDVPTIPYVHLAVYNFEINQNKDLL